MDDEFDTINQIAEQLHKLSDQQFELDNDELAEKLVNLSLDLHNSAYVLNTILNQRYDQILESLVVSNAKLNALIEMYK